MAKTNAIAVQDSTEHTQEPDKLAETPTTPVAPDIGSTLEDDTPPWEISVSDTNNAPKAHDVTDAKVAVSSNIIEGVFGEKRAAAVEAEKQDAEQNKVVQETSKPEKQVTPKKAHSGRPPKDKPDNKLEAEKPKKANRAPRLPKGLKEEKQTEAVGGGDIDGQNMESTPAPTTPELPALPKDATRPGAEEKIVYISLADLHLFNTYRPHPFGVRNDAEMQDTVESVKQHGVQNPAIVRSREDGGYEIISGHRRHKASELAGYENMPCIVREMSDYDAVQLMKHSNKQRNVTLPSELARVYDLELEAIKHQGARLKDIASGDVGKRSNEIVATNNNTTVKQVQRYISLNKLVPDLMQLVDDKKIPFTSAVEMSYIKPKNQRYIVVAIDAQQSAPSLAQARRMRELDQKGVLNGDIIDGIMFEEKKEEIRVIINSQELGKYFGPDKSPRDMKEQIMKLLDEWKDRQPPELAKPTKKQEAEK